MQNETQAAHLAKMMQKHIHNTQYELALPLVSIRRSKLKKLSVNDVLLLDVSVLEFILLEGDVLCADLVLQRVEGKDVVVITHLHTKMIVSNERYKYETIKLSFGKCQMKSFEVGDSLALTQFDLEKIMLIWDDKKIAEGSLVNVDHALALKIMLVESV